MCVIELVLRDLISHKHEKPLSHKYVLGIWTRTETSFFAIVLYSSTFSRCTQNSVGMIMSMIMVSL